MKHIAFLTAHNMLKKSIFHRSHMYIEIQILVTTPYSHVNYLKFQENNSFNTNLSSKVTRWFFRISYVICK